jgi:hypothetical protein
MKYTIFLLAVLVMASCQKVIDVDLNSTDQQVIIEAEITDDPAYPNRVLITKSLNFDEENNFPYISGASVIISDGGGNSYVLNDMGNGIYTNNTLIGVPGQTYYLTIEIEGTIYSATSTMPLKVPLQSVDLTDGGFGPPGAAGTSSPVPVFTDPLGQGNNYRFHLYENQERARDILLTNDEILDGGTNTSNLFSQDLTFDSGDTAKVVMMCIDKQVYDHFYALSLNGSGPNASASPANPASTISGGVLGYFSAHTRETKYVVVP